MPTSSCDFHQHDILYEGQATKIRDDTTNQRSDIPAINPSTVYSLITQDITFALTTTKSQQLCGYTILQVEHPKLFIVEVTKGDTVKPRGSIPVDILDIFAYVNSKFVYVEKHVRSQIINLYYNVMKQRCNLEQVLKNTLSLVSRHGEPVRV
ncbi:hypothetical protein EAI_05125 [Harpegnathos saltator]|uniref:Uncharacterized protein n=1 Tax=Harpegnathos saltator TaxID=610380 RepID=E2B9N2_HARSA|nr:hypothetical protein EAI_05125 [Harpegnathos saltator]